MYHYTNIEGQKKGQIEKQINKKRSHFYLLINNVSYENIYLVCVYNTNLVRVIQ